MRKRLLEYCLNPRRISIESSENGFDSDFEKDVYEYIKNKGYNVRTQVPAGDKLSQEYRIDLVVEGMRGRIAIECDGDKWHGPDRYEYDMARQRQLERVGWKFFRVLASEYYRDPAKALELLWEMLRNNFIEPGGIDSAITNPPPPAKLEYVVQYFDIPVEEVETDISKQKESSDLIGDTLKTELYDQTKEVLSSISINKTEDLSSAETRLDENVEYVNTISHEEWFALSHWAKENNHFQGWERSLLFSIGKRIVRKIPVTEKQARQAVRIHKASIELGYLYQSSEEEQKSFDL